VRVCYFGTYEKNYPRNRVVIDALRDAGMEVVECHVPVWELTRHKTGKFFSPGSLLILAVRIMRGYGRLVGRYFRSARRADIIMVGYIGQLDLLLVRLLMVFGGRRRLIFNPLVSLYDTLIDDRGLFAPGSLPARLLFALDRWAFRLSDRIILDTTVHIDYISEKFNIEDRRFVRTFIGADERIFAPQQGEPDVAPWTVLFVGKFIPLHGLDHIITAASLLQDDPEIRFQIVGTGQLYDDVMKLCRDLAVTNIDFIDWIPYEELPRQMARAQVCLGIFSRGGKTGRVIPNKVFQGLAVGMAVITGDSPASRELLTDGQDALLVPRGDPGAMAEAIRSLNKDRQLRLRLAAGGRAIFQKRCSTAVLGRELKMLFGQIMDQS
jgi:glycosyltransferase involved in cell wall biosynthesis